MPSTTTAEFVNEIQRDPDLLERFYRKTFTGLDSSSGKPGMRRVKATGFYLVQGDKLVEASKVPNNKYSINNFFASLQKYEYHNGPYGSGDMFQPDNF